MVNVVVIGSISLLLGFIDCLNYEFIVMFFSVKVKFYVVGFSSERWFGVWIGGSIFGSLGIFY